MSSPRTANPRENEMTRVLVVGAAALSKTTRNMVLQSLTATGSEVDFYDHIPDAVAHVHNPNPDLIDNLFPVRAMIQEMIDDPDLKDAFPQDLLDLIQAETGLTPTPEPYIPFQNLEAQEDETGELDGGEPMFASFFTVALYNVGLAFGGHEEGGWWYDQGDPISDPTEIALPFEFVMPRYFEVQGDVEKARKAAYDYCRLLNDVIEARLKQPSKSNVNVSSVVEARVSDGMPHAFPSRRPHYE